MLGSDRAVLRSDLLAADLIYTAVDRVQKALCKVSAGAKELHLLADAHGGYTACNSVVIPVYHAHDIIILVLDRRVPDGCLCAETL